MRSIDIAQYNTTEELYNEHQKKFNIRWILFSTFLAIFCVLLMIAFIEYAVRRQDYILNYINVFSSVRTDAQPSDAQAAANQLYTRKFTLSIIGVLGSLAMFIWHMVSYLLSMKKKDFSRYSPWLSSLYSLVIVFTIINLFFSMGSFFRIESWNVNQILNVSYTFVLPIGYFGFYFPCSTIIKMFRYVKTKEQLKKLGANGDPLNMLNQMFANNASQNELETEKKLSEKNTLPFVINDLDENKANNQKAIDFRAQLETLDDKKIILMAQKLNIFGAAELSREQLIDKIIMIFENIKKDQDQNNNENDLAKKDNKTNEDETKFENDKKEEKDSDEIQ